MTERPDHKELFRARLAEGYTHMAVGEGDWVRDSYRINWLWAFYHPDGKVKTYEESAIREDGIQKPGSVSEEEYTRESLQLHADQYKISFRPEKSLKEIVSSWE